MVLFKCNESNSLSNKLLTKRAIRYEETRTLRGLDDKVKITMPLCFRKKKKRVTFVDHVLVIEFSDTREEKDSRVGHWHRDGARFRMRIAEAEKILGPVMSNSRGNDEEVEMGQD